MEDSTFEELLAEIKACEESWAATVRPGDLVDSQDDKFFTFSKHQYQTKDKLYVVKAVDVRTDRSGHVYSRTVMVDGDYVDENGVHQINWLSPSRVIVRDGKVIWINGFQRAIHNMMQYWDMLCESEREYCLEHFWMPELQYHNRVKEHKQ